ncbi:MAG TPA: molybdenum cofactor biosynthesis protein MoaE [Rhodanobacteraceae bacterium]|nr:molybdenum cofactor biosynthesis protein MoaE [Rhodanobacteraceae bacterium]
MTPRFSLSDSIIDAISLRRELESERAGALVTFEGRVRNHNEGRAVRGLQYEAYAELAEAEGARIIEEVLARFEIAQVLCVHRVGELALGELAVWVGVSAAHRDAAFAACRYVIDEIKTRVPIWKHERYADGEAEWLHPADH